MTEPKLLSIARADLGLREIPGARHNPRIVEMFAEAGFSGVKDDGTAWCAAAVGSWLKRAGIQPSGSLAARSYLDWGEAVAEPVPGCVVIFPRGKGWQGHVGIVSAVAGDRLKVISGNQRNAVTEAGYSAARALGFRVPTGETSRPEWPLGIGSRGRRVTALQEALRGLGYTMVGKADGAYGKATRDAVMALQADNHIAVDGKVDAALYARLDGFAPRAVGEARATTSAAELAERSRIAGQASKGATETMVALGSGAVGAGVKIADTVAEDPGSVLDSAVDAAGKAGAVARTAEQGFDLVERLTGGAVSVEMVLAIVAAVVIGTLAWQWWRLRRILEARLEDERSGKTR